MGCTIQQYPLLNNSRQQFWLICACFYLTNYQYHLHCDCCLQTSVTWPSASIDIAPVDTSVIGSSTVVNCPGMTFTVGEPLRFTPVEIKPAAPGMYKPTNTCPFFALTSSDYNLTFKWGRCDILYACIIAGYVVFGEACLYYHTSILYSATLNLGASSGVGSLLADSVSIHLLTQFYFKAI